MSARRVLTTARTCAYGRWRAVLVLPDGTEFEGWGISEAAAIYRAQSKANPITTCPRGAGQDRAAAR